MREGHPLAQVDLSASGLDPKLVDQREEDVALARELLAQVFDELDKLLPEGRYKSLAMTMLETAAMWAVKSITHRK